jgi:hypothetical protein
MSWLPDPEKMMSGIMRSMGVGPEDFVNFIRSVSTEIQEMRADRLAFKPASIKAYQELTARMERMETKLDRVLARVEPQPFGLELSDNERRDLNGH